MERAAKRRAGAFALALSMMLAAGCGGADAGLDDVAGSVTFAGKPVVFGAIEFVPDVRKGHKGPPGRAGIIDGRYDTAAEGRGIVRGPHQVKITAYEEVLPPAPEFVDETKPYESPEPLFTGYTIEADITGETKDFEVPESAKGSNSFARARSRPAVNVP